MTTDLSGATDMLDVALRSAREPADDAGGYGVIAWRLLDAFGNLKDAGEVRNRITDYGDEWNTKRSVGTAVAVVTGMRLGTGATAAAKNGAGAAIVTYIAGSSRALDAAATTATLGAGLGWRASHVVTWPAGVATNAAITEVAVTNEAGPTDVAGVVGNTIARAVIASVNKTATDSLEITWRHDHLAP